MRASLFGGDPPGRVADADDELPAADRLLRIFSVLVFPATHSERIDSQKVCASIFHTARAYLFAGVGCGVCRLPRSLLCAFALQA